MSHRQGWPAIVTLLLVFCALYVGVLGFRVGPETTVVPIAGRALPAGIHAGDRIDRASSWVTSRMGRYQA